MANVAFTPSVDYKKEYQTKVEKIDFNTGINLLGVRITRNSNQVSNATELLYQVPEGKTFFLTSFQMTSINNAASGTGTWLYIDPFFTHNILILGSFGAVAVGAHESLNQVVTPTIPLRLNSGEKIYTRSASTSFYAYSQITGIEISTSLIPNFV